MKKVNIAFIFAFIVCFGMLTGCGSKTTVSTSSNSSSSKEETVQTTQSSYDLTCEPTEIFSDETSVSTTETMSDAVVDEVPIQTDDSATVSKNSDGSFNVTFGDNACSMTFPESWNGRFVIDDYEVYSKKCWDNKEKTGKLFSLASFEDDDMTNVIPDSYLLGTYYYEYIILFKPTDVDYDVMNTELHDEFSLMSGDIDSIISSSTCSTSVGFTPIDLSIYDTPNNCSNAVSGTWESPDTGTQFAPFITFRPKDNAFAYSYALDGANTEYEEGKYFMNTLSSDYEWNTNNWGEFGLILLDGSIYSFKLYYSAPTMIEISKLTGISDYDEITTQTWLYSSEFTDFDINYND